VVKASGSAEVAEDADEEAFKDTLYRLALLGSKDFVLDIHFNYNAPGAYGTESFVHDYTSKANRDRASKLTAAVSSVIGTANRGVKSEGDSQHTRLAVLHYAPAAVLLEVCFLNSKDLPLYLKKKEKVADAIAEIIKQTTIG
jgi:N-acetylmuramoyl-L-alanine amidase